MKQYFENGKHYGYVQKYMSNLSWIIQLFHVLHITQNFVNVIANVHVRKHVITCTAIYGKTIYTHTSARVLKTLPHHPPMSVVELGPMGFTSERLHESVRLTCILGCEDTDSLTHYTFM